MRKLALTFTLLALLMFPMGAPLAQTANPLDVPAEVGTSSVPTLDVVASEIPQVADPTPEVAVIMGVVVTTPVTLVVTIPQTPEQVGQQVVQAADNFKTGAWVAGLLALIGVILFFVGRFVKSKTNKKT